MRTSKARRIREAYSMYREQRDTMLVLMKAHGVDDDTRHIVSHLYMDRARRFLGNRDFVNIYAVISVRQPHSALRRMMRHAREKRA